MSGNTDSTPQAQFADLIAIMNKLRSPGGCPWDQEQDHRSLRRCLLEEAYEVLQAIDSSDPAALRQELGDLLLQVIFHAQLAAEAGHFDIADVIQDLHDKLVKRHPHVFSDKVIESAEAVVQEWESLKREERGHTTADQMSGVPQALPALARAQVAQRQARRAGLEPAAEGGRRALAEALRRLDSTADAHDVEGAVGDLLFAAVDLARGHGVEAEQALRERVNRFVAEFSRRPSDA